MNPTPNQKNINYGTIHAETVRIGDDYITYQKYSAAQEVKIPHRLTNNIPTNADHILGRATELERIFIHLAENKPTVLVNGLGGIGKTSVASKYVATYGHLYKHLAWLTVQSSVAEAFTNDLVLLKSLHIEQDVRQLIETQRLTDAFKLVVHKLNTLEHTLVVLDNANNPDDLIAHKNLFDTAKCHYLITSRTQPQEWTIVEIDHLPPDEAVNLFRKIAPSVSATDEDLKSLLSKLFYHTLLIELVAKAVENAGFSFVELQTMIETKFIHDEQLNEDIVSTGKHGDSVADNRKRAKIEEYIWLIFSNVKDLGYDAKQILRGMALLPVATPFDRAFLKEHLALFEVKEIVPNLSLLVEWGWLEKEQNKWFKMHPLIVDLVVKHLGVDVNFAKEYISKIASLIYFNNSIPEHNLFEKSKFKPLGERLIVLFFNTYTDEMSELFEWLGYIEENFGYYEKAIEYKKRALQIAETIYDNDNSVIGLRKSNLGWAYQNIGKYERAAELLESALVNYYKNFGLDHKYVSIIQSNLGIVYRNVGRYKDAATLLQKALLGDLKNLGEKHPQVAIKKANLALVYHDLGNYTLAIKLLEEALQSDMKNFGVGHPNLALRQSNLAWIYYKVGKKKEAKVLWKSAYQNYFNNFGDGHPDTIKFKKYLEL